MASVSRRQREEQARIAKTLEELTLKTNTERGFRILDRNFVSELHSKDLRMCLKTLLAPSGALVVIKV